VEITDTLGDALTFAGDAEDVKVVDLGTENDHKVHGTVTKAETASLRVTTRGTRPAAARCSTVCTITGLPPSSSSSLFLPYRADSPEAITMQPMA
jgi:hypothetical protein